MNALSSFVMTTLELNFVPHTLHFHFEWRQFPYFWRKILWKKDLCREECCPRRHLSERNWWAVLMSSINAAKVVPKALDFATLKRHLWLTDSRALLVKRNCLTRWQEKRNFVILEEDLEDITDYVYLHIILIAMIRYVDI